MGRILGGRIHRAVDAGRLPRHRQSTNGSLRPHARRGHWPHAAMGDAGMRIESAEGLAQQIEAWRTAAGMPARLGACGIRDGILPILAEEASQQWTGRFNPAPMSEIDFLQLYRSAM